MSKDTADINNSSMPEETAATQTSLDLLNSFLNAPVTKLDADEYLANDIDGVTESLIGSGNMNFMMMQAGQSNEAMKMSNPFGTASGDSAFGASPLFSPNGAQNGAAADTATDRAIARPDDFGGSSENGPVNNSSSTAGSLGASNLAASSAALNPLSDSGAFSAALSVATSSLPAGNGQNGGSGGNGANGVSTSGADGSNGTIGTDGTSGSNGTDGTNGGGGGTTIINIDNSVGDTTVSLIDQNFLETIENIYSSSTTNVTNVTNEAGDVLTTVVNNTFETINNAGDTLGDNIENIYNETGDVISTIINNGGDLLTTIVNNTYGTVNNITNGGGLGPVGISLDATLDNVTNLNLDIINGGNIINVLNETLNTAPVLQPVGNIVGDLVSNTSLDVILNPFQYDNSPGDYDLHVGTGLDVLDVPVPDLALDVPLDPVEGLLGDIDISLDLTDDLLSLDPLLGGGTPDTDIGVIGIDALAPVTETLEGVVNPVEDLTGDIDITAALELELLGIGDADTGGSDTDVFVPLDLDLLDTDLLSDGIGLSLDPVETLTGDIDLDATVAADLLGSVADGLIDAQPGGTGMETPLSMIGDSVSDLAGGLLPLGDSNDTDLAVATGVDILDSGLAGNGGELFLNPVENLVGDIDISGSAGLDLLGTAQAGGTDSDIIIPLDLNLSGGDVAGDTLSVSLDPVENITGDIDLNLTAAGDIFGGQADPLVDSMSGGTGGSNDILSQTGNLAGDALGIAAPFGSNGEPDLDLGTGLDLGATDILNNDAVISFDPVENITGDLDIGGVQNFDLDLVNVTTGNTDIFTQITADPAGGVLGGGTSAPNVNMALYDLTGDTNGLLGSLVDTLNTTLSTAITTINSAPSQTGGLDLNALGGSGAGAANTTIDHVSTWTETVLPQAGSVLGGGLISNVIDIIPDPVAVAPVAALPLPVAPVVPVAGNLLGGLGGGNHHHHGGLFG